MRKSSFSEDQILGVLHEQGAGVATGTGDVCRKHGISEQTFCRWNRARAA